MIDMPPRLRQLAFLIAPRPCALCRDVAYFAVHLQAQDGTVASAVELCERDLSDLYEHTASFGEQEISLQRYLAWLRLLGWPWASRDKAALDALYARARNQEEPSA